MLSFLIYTASIIFFDYFMNQFFTDRLLNWYAIHVYCNMYVVIKTLPIIYLYFNNPIYALTDSTEYNIHYYAIIPHIYHCLAFNLTKDDIFHHVVFVFCGILFKLMIDVGFTIAFYLFFINGLPGAIDYTMLILYKTNHITKLKRHRLAVFLNSWIRCPGLIFSNSLLVCYILANDSISSLLKCVYIVMSFYMWSYNGLYYNYLVRDSFNSLYLKD